MKLAALIILSLGAAAFVGGCFAFSFGVTTPSSVMVSRFGPFNGLWKPEDYCFLGAILGAIGAGLLGLAFGWFADRFRQGQSVRSKRRMYLWTLLVMTVIAATGVTGAMVVKQVGPRLTSKDGEDARITLAVYLARNADRKHTKELTTPEFQHHLESQHQRFFYDFNSIVSASTDYDHQSQKITVVGIMTTTMQTTEVKMDEPVPGMNGMGVFTMPYDPPKQFDFIARLVKGSNGTWLIDEVEYHEH